MFCAAAAISNFIEISNEKLRKEIVWPPYPNLEKLVLQIGRAMLSPRSKMHPSTVTRVFSAVWNVKYDVKPVCAAHTNSYTRTIILFHVIYDGHLSFYKLFCVFCVLYAIRTHPKSLLSTHPTGFVYIFNGWIFNILLHHSLQLH